MHRATAHLHGALAVAELGLEGMDRYAARSHELGELLV